jgi:transcriptional regulator with XRE-family HTH domain
LTLSSARTHPSSSSVRADPQRRADDVPDIVVGLKTWPTPGRYRHALVPRGMLDVVSSELGEFLRSRRERLSPTAIGLTDGVTRRRVRGLRREELAQLAGVSAGYYARLEQGVSSNASASVLDALARVLQLDDDECAHLHVLAQPRRQPVRRARPERLRASLRTLLDAFRDVPAVVIGRSTDVLAWNRMGHALLAGHLDFDAPEDAANRPNIARLLFLDPHTRELYRDWRAKAADTVAGLHQMSARYPGDQLLAQLIGELTMASTEFASMWTARPVRTCSFYLREFRHPLVGDMTLANESLVLPDDDGQQLGIFYAEANSPAAAALMLLARTIAQTPSLAGKTEHPRGRAEGIEESL